MTENTTIKKPRKLQIAITFFILAGILTATALWQIKSFIKSPARINGQEKIFTIEKGESLAHISNRLADQGLVKNRFLFRLLVEYRKVSKKIQSGEYALSSSMTPEELLAIIVKGRVILHRLTIPEGMNLEETALLVEMAGFGTREDFLNLTRDPGITANLKVPADNLEGYLFPETYFFPRTTTQKEIIQQMVHRFHKVFTPQWQERSHALGFSIHEIVTLASIIEKETGDSSERPIISSVFHNRLKKGMRLESDPTVIYGIFDFNGNITKKDLMTLTPYNTYKIEGLPKGPIANPGRLSLESALFPITSDFLFFVSKKDTTHKFSTNFKDHNRAVEEYQLEK